MLLLVSPLPFRAPDVQKTNKAEYMCRLVASPESRFEMNALNLGDEELSSVYARRRSTSSFARMGGGCKAGPITLYFEKRSELLVAIRVFDVSGIGDSGRWAR